MYTISSTHLLTLCIFYIVDTVNPLDSEEPNFALVSKAQSSSTVMSNLSFVSASLGSDLDMRTKSAEDLNFLNRERRLGSSGSRASSGTTGRQRRNSHRSSTEALMRSLADLEAESSVDPDVTLDSATPINTKPRPEDIRPTGQNLHGSQSSLANTNVNRRSSQRSVSSIDISGLKVSSVDVGVAQQQPRQGSPSSDTSDVDSYSDITSQQKRENDYTRTHQEAGGLSRKGLVLRKTHSSSSSGSSVAVKPEESSAGGKTPGSISQLRTQQTDHRIPSHVDKPGRHGIPSSAAGITKASTPNLRKSPQKPSLNGTPMKYRSEGNLASYHDPVHSPPSNGLLTTLRDDMVLTNGDVHRSQYKTPHDPSLPNGGPSTNRPNLRRLFRTQDKPRVNGIAGKPNAVSSDEDHKTIDDELFYSQTKYANNLRTISGSNEYLSRTPGARPDINRVITAQNTYTDRTRSPRKPAQDLSVHITSDSYSSQGSSADSPTDRQIAAEHAAAALMQNHHSSSSGPSRSGSSLTLENLAMKDLRDKDAAHVRLKQNHMANLAHLHSSSC